MVVVPCPVAGCLFQTLDQEPAVVAALLQLHATAHSTTNLRSNGPKLDRPSIEAGVAEESWNSFKRLWDAYRAGSQIPDSAATIQLLQCASRELADLVYKSDPQVTSRPVDEVLALLRVLAVVPVARGVTRAALMQMHQDNDENFRTFTVRVRGKAEICKFQTTAKCVCTRTVTTDYTEEVIRDVVLAGASDIDIRREALSTEGLQEKTVNEIIAFVESREMARKAVNSRHDNTSSLSATSSFKREKADSFKSQVSGKSEYGVCSGCGSRHPLFRRNKNGWNRRPYKLCFGCWSSTKKPPGESKGKSSSVTVLAASQISMVRTEPKVGHQIFSDGAWRNSGFRQHPILVFKLCLEGRDDFISIKAIADTGAQSNLWGYRDFTQAGFHASDLRAVYSQFCVADNRTIDVLGSFNGVFQGSSPDGRTITCRSMVYVSKSVTGFFLSYDTMEHLYVLDSRFPEVGRTLRATKVT